MTADAGAMSDLDAGQVVDAGPSTEQTTCGPVTPGVDTCCPVDMERLWEPNLLLHNWRNQRTAMSRLSHDNCWS